MAASPPPLSPTMCLMLLLALVFFSSLSTRPVVECASTPVSAAESSLSVSPATRAQVTADTIAWATRLSKAHPTVTADRDLSLGRALVILPPCNATVSQRGGNGTHRTVQDAVNSIPRNRGNRRWVICVEAGTYREKVKLISIHSHVTLVGTSRNPSRVVISWGDTAGTLAPGSTTKILETYNSYTFAAEAPFFTAMYITFANTAPRPADGAVGGQAVALRATGDYMSFFRCDFTGYQDTLYAHQGIQFYKNCNIRGSVDFIFGNATAWFYKCYIYADVVTKGFLTAQSRNAASQSTGFAFFGGSVKGTGLVYLGRAWNLASRVVFSRVTLDQIIAPLGWDNWGQPTDAIFYAEYRCIGPGSATDGRVNWSIVLTADQARIFGSCDFIRARTWQGDSGLPPAGLPCPQ